MEKPRNANPEARKPVGRPRRTRKINVKIDLKEVRYEYVDWIHVFQDEDQRRTFINRVTRLSGPINLGTAPVGLSSRTVPWS
jgi:hypothetical protein